MVTEKRCFLAASNAHKDWWYCNDGCALWDDGNKGCSFKSIVIEVIKLNERLEDTASM